MPDVTSKPIPTKQKHYMSKKLIAISLIIVIIIGTLTFLGFEWYEYKLFSNSAIPIFKTSIALSKDLERIESRSILSISKDDLKEIADTVKSLKLRTAEIPIKSKSSSDIQDTLILMLENQEDRIYFLTVSISNYYVKKNTSSPDLIKNLNNTVTLQEIIKEDTFLNQKYYESLKLYDEYRLQLTGKLLP